MLTPSDAGPAHPRPRSGIRYQEAYVGGRRSSLIPDICHLEA